jgi:hypothetical protein
MERVKRMPRLLLRWFSYKVRSDYRFYQRYFGSYGISALGSKGAAAHALNTVANTGSAFLMGSVREAPVIRGGRVEVGEVLTVAVVVDHFLLDGLDVLDAMRTLRRVLHDPVRLGLPAPGASAASAAVPAPREGAARA